MKRLVEATRRIPDPRRQWGNLRHQLGDILTIGFCAIICGAQSYHDIELFGQAKEIWLSNYLALPNGIPNADTFERIFEILDSQTLAKQMRWILQSTDVAGKIVAFDGKTMCGTANEERRSFHTLSAFLVDDQTVLGEVMCDEKSNEITAIPELLGELNVKGAVITIDAMGTQTKIAKKIIEKKADYCLALKGNHSNLHDDVQLYFETETVEKTKTVVEKGHGRIEKREYFLETSIDWLYERERWEGLCAIGAVKSTVIRKGISTWETRYFLTSLKCIDCFAEAVRAHWGIENCLHWHLDVSFGEDSSRIRDKNAAAVWNILRKLALEYLKRAQTKNASIKSLRKLAGWDSFFLESVVFGEK